MPLERWHLASVTKPMTALLVGLFIDQGRLRWDTPLHELYPTKALHPEVRAVTIEQLLSHTAGVADVREHDQRATWRWLRQGDPRARTKRDTLVERLLAAPPRFPAGARQEYSNAGYVILGHILEGLEGTAWEELLTQRILAPLGMRSCGFGAPGVHGESTPSAPWGHQLLGERLVALAPGPLADNPWAFGPAGTLHCALADVVKFYQLLLAAEGQQLVTSETWHKLMSATRPGLPLARSSLRLLEREWAQGPVQLMTGSNTLNLMTVLLAPRRRRVYLVATNAATVKAREALSEILNLLTRLE